MHEMSTAIVLIFIGITFFAYYRKTPIAFIFSALISFASALYMFEMHGLHGGSFNMFGTIFIVFGLWQIVEVVRHYD